MKRVRGTVLVAALVTACTSHGKPPRTAPGASGPTQTISLVPAPVKMNAIPVAGLDVGPSTVVVAYTETPEIGRIAQIIATLFKQATGVPVAVRGHDAIGAAPSLMLMIDPRADLGDEGYDLNTAGPMATLKARTAAGLFYGTQTLRQLLPYWSEYRAVPFLQPKPLTLPAVHVVDTPRYPWRGAMLDVARHFFGVADVERYIDLLALNKMNRLHLHLADDQGWRIEITKHPQLTARGGSTQVGGGPGGFFTQAQFAEIVAYAGDRFVTIVPEIDMPGHTNAALASVPELNCNGQAPELFTGTDVGFSAMCVEKDATYRFIDDIVSEIAAMTPGPYFHAGGDEVKTLTPRSTRHSSSACKRSWARTANS